jgi:hypothetical protein
MSNTEEGAVRYHTRNALAERWSVTTRTIDDWHSNRKIPPADLRLPNGSPRWADLTITRFERENVARGSAA